MSLREHVSAGTGIASSPSGPPGIGPTWTPLGSATAFVAEQPMANRHECLEKASKLITKASTTH